MTYAVTVDFFGIDTASPEQASAVMAEMLQSVGFTRFEVREAREV
ncbi:MAG: hypothetical protein V3V07_02310 [candidate division NC10 bacterium]|jgi:hypothetical protein|nr:hypothetical protein [candidate division NC10 bacterium]